MLVNSVYQENLHLQFGLTMIELLVTLSTAMILLVIGVPSFIDMIASNTATSNANDLLADLNLARNEAISRGVRVTVCHSGDSQLGNSATCSGTWTEGWIVFANTNTTTYGVRDGDDAVLRVHGKLPQSWTLKGNGNVPHYIAFRHDGRASTFNSFDTGTFVFCKDGIIKVGNRTRSSAVTVNRTGRARVLQDTDGDGSPNDANGNLGNNRC
jgi:type IV fimbrial biogenesis protein FimT